MSDVARHYGTDGLTERILGALEDAGIDLAVDGRAALSGVDEFHLGFHRATVEIAAALDVGPDSRVVDLGCGIGGAARHLASSTGCRVMGIDLTPEFIATAIDLTDRVGMNDRVEFCVGSATEIPVDDDTFDAATVLHVGMNIADKPGLMNEIARVLRPGGHLVLYDIMRVGDGDITYPVPWASSAESSFVEEPAAYVSAMEGAGFDVGATRDMTGLVLEVMAAARDSGPPPATLVTLMGPDFPTMIGNLVPLVQGGTLAPTLIAATAT